MREALGHDVFRANALHQPHNMGFPSRIAYDFLLMISITCVHAGRRDLVPNRQRTMGTEVAEYLRLSRAKIYEIAQQGSGHAPVVCTPKRHKHHLARGLNRCERPCHGFAGLPYPELQSPRVPQTR